MCAFRRRCVLTWAEKPTWAIERSNEKAGENPFFGVQGIFLRVAKRQVATCLFVLRKSIKKGIIRAVRPVYRACGNGRRRRSGREKILKLGTKELPVEHRKKAPSIGRRPKQRCSYVFADAAISAFRRKLCPFHPKGRPACNDPLLFCGYGIGYPLTACGFFQSNHPARPI